MLSHAYFLAKFRFDTAENEPSNIWQPLAILPYASKTVVESFRNLRIARASATTATAARTLTGRRSSVGPTGSARRQLNAFLKNAFFENAIFENLQIFGGLFLGCIKTKFCKKIIQNMRLTAFFKLYKICILLHRCNLIFLLPIAKKSI